MPRDEDMQAAVEAYVANYNRGDTEGLLSLFAADAKVEDPVGSPPRTSKEAIRELFAGGIAAGARLHLDGPIRIAASHAAFPFHVALEWEGRATRIDVIDIFRFDENGKIAEMRAFFGAGNMTNSKGD